MSASCRAFWCFRVNAFESTALKAAKQLLFQHLSTVQEQDWWQHATRKGLCRFPLFLAGFVTQCCLWATSLLIGAALRAYTCFFGKGMRVQVLALCITTAALLRSIWVLADFSLLPVGETHIIPALSGKKTKQKGRKIKGLVFRIT